MQGNIGVQLPADCLREIFENLAHDNESLRTFLLVNRLWCETVVPILWRDPFKLKKPHNYDPKFWKSIARTLLSCLPEESIILFRHNGIHPPMLSLEENLDERKLPLFDYVGYCQNLSCHHIYEIIPEILGHETIMDISWYYNGNLVENELWKLFMSRCSTMKYLELPNIQIDYYTSLNSKGSCLNQLVELECSTYKLSHLFLELAQICVDIKKIVINLCDDDNEGLVTLISTQKNLKEIVLISSESVQCPLIGEAIGTQYPSLIGVRFEEHICIPSTVLTKLINLKHIQIDLDEDVNSKLELLDNCSFPLLETLSIRNVNGKYLDLYTKLIKNTNGFLKHIEVDTVPHPSLNQIKQYWQALINHCPQLEFVTLWFKDDSLSDLKKLLTTCGNKIKGIMFEGVLGQFSFSWRPMDLKHIFDLLVTSINVNGIEELHFSGAWTFNPKDLRNFLNNWGKKNLVKDHDDKDQKAIKNPLYLSFKFDFQLTKETTDIFEEFVNNGVLKGWSR